MYSDEKCSPPVSSHTKAILTINSFEKGGDGGGPSECDGLYHSNSLQIVALSTGWFNHRSGCHRNIIINGNGRSVRAMVVDKCDSNRDVLTISLMHPGPCGKRWVSRCTVINGVGWMLLGPMLDQSRNAAKLDVVGLSLICLQYSAGDTINLLNM
ncbi:putative ripening-related protein 2 [Punica granatum]|uniref:Uncharacterized protein n=2 Tax=Punica granatum TaxID=22663 RepID=A0A218WB99_PUNGR|nr:putative ripening-related protein 2 [Punica granatum]OWM69471.1 hypothetical protein CDL15_Pgr013932 [Punica granatum]OWM88216.1 hypothetical protein CDL15_Pgr003628 [Punica granatum]PKI45429.1 hypothetical protein CRG98_034234 [Punica granatum]